MLTLEPATAWGFNDRGLIRVGMAADLIVFRPSKVAPDASKCATTCHRRRRLVQEAAGISAAVVKPTVLMRNSKYTGVYPGEEFLGPAGCGALKATQSIPVGAGQNPAPFFLAFVCHSARSRKRYPDCHRLPRGLNDENQPARSGRSERKTCRPMVSSAAISVPSLKSIPRMISKWSSLPGRAVPKPSSHCI